MKRELLFLAAVWLAIVTAAIYATRADASTATHRWPHNQESAFITSCMSSGGLPLRCSCALRYLEAHYSWQLFSYIVANQPYRYAKIINNLPRVC